MSTARPQGMLDDVKSVWSDIKNYETHNPVERDLDPRDRWIEYTTWLKQYSLVAQLALRWGPVKLIKAMQQYPWIYDLIKVNNFYARHIYGRTGRYREMISYLSISIVENVIYMLEFLVNEPEKMVIFEDLVPPEIAYAMGLHRWMPEVTGILGPILDPHDCERYIDSAENAGCPPDVCTLPKIVMGITVDRHLPVGQAVCTANLPCDGGMCSYGLIERLYGTPTYRLDVPHYFKDEKGIDYFVKDLRGMIAFLEKNTCGKMDWDKLKDICTERNKQRALELELWELNSISPAPLPGEAAWLNHMWNFNIFPGQPSTTRCFEKAVELAKANLADGIGAVPNEKYRSLLWNPPTCMYADLFTWAERTYGISVIVDSMTYNRQPEIDTTSEESMLRGLAVDIMEGPMCRHTRGPMTNYWDDMFFAYDYLNLDMIMMAGHIGCKNTQALNGIMREKCREKGIPLMVYDYDLMDPRVVSQQGIRDQVSHFMDNVMHAEIFAAA